MMSSARLAVAMLAVVSLVLLAETAPQQVQARLNYAKQFSQDYPKLADQAKEAKCNVCHEGTSKKALGGKKIEKPTVISEAFKKTEKEPSAAEGKTFGDLIEAGMLPASSP